MDTFKKVTDYINDKTANVKFRCDINYYGDGEQSPFEYKLRSEKLLYLQNKTTGTIFQFNILAIKYNEVIGHYFVDVVYSYDAYYEKHMMLYDFERDYDIII